jgi:hypothetical protein
MTTKSRKPDEQCQIIQFSALAAAAKLAKMATGSPGEGTLEESLAEYRAAKIARREARLEEVTTAPETLTESCRNHRLRQARRDVWWQASQLTDYLRARMDWHSALSTAQSWNVPGANSYPRCKDDENRIADVSAWRVALVQQMLTPAPDVAAVNWKRIQLRGGQYRYVGVKPERLQRAIDADVEWLAAHPSRKSIAASRQAKKD